MKKNSYDDEEVKLKNKMRLLIVSLMERKKNYTLFNEVMFYLEAGLIESGKDILLNSVGK